MKNKKVVTFGEVMMRLSPTGLERIKSTKQFEINFGGAEANVAVSLSHWGIPTEHVTALPENDFGKATAAHLLAHGVSTKNIRYSDHRLGLYFLEHGADIRSSKVIYDRADSAFANIASSDFNWHEILKDAAWFHWSGITPAISQGAADACYEAIRTARKLGVKISGDINYRRNLWQYGKNPDEVMPSFISESDIIVGGLVDFENCANIASHDFKNACEKIHRQFPSVKKIANTERVTIHATHNLLSATAWDGHAFHHSKEYDLTQIVDRVGSGDAFMAGLIYGWLCEWKDKDVIEFAMAACALKHTIPGDVNCVAVDEVNDLVKGNNIGKLLR